MKNKNGPRWFVFSRYYGEDDYDYEFVGHYPSKKEAEDAIGDISGHEFLVIRGAQKEVVANRPYIKD